MCILSKFSLYLLKPCGSPKSKPCFSFKVKCSGSSSSWCKIPELGDPMWSLDPLLLTENLGNYSPIYALSIWGYRSCLYPVYVPLAHLICPLLRGAPEFPDLLRSGVILMGLTLMFWSDSMASFLLFLNPCMSIVSPTSTASSSPR